MTATLREDLKAPLADVRFLVQRALAEDLTPLGDITSSLLDPARRATATIGARADGVLAGCLCVEETFAAVDDRLSVNWEKTDGARVAAGEIFAVAEGPFATMLTAERTALNFLSHLSGVATNAALWVELAAGRL